MQPSDRIARRIRLHDLQVLMAVVQAGSMNKAANLLNTTQPAVSKTIAELEHTVGVRLLDRHRQGVEPTRHGRVLLDGGVAVFDDLRQTLQNIAFLDDPAAGNIRIGCSPSLAASFVSAVIDRVSRLFPRVTFELVSAPGEIILPDLHERNRPADHPEHLARRGPRLARQHGFRARLERRHHERSGSGEVGFCSGVSVVRHGA